MNFLINTILFYIALSLLSILYKDLPFSKITLRNLFLLFLGLILILSFIPPFIYLKGAENCTLKCTVLAGIPVFKTFTFLPLISTLSFFTFSGFYLKKDLKFKGMPFIFFGKNRNGISIKGILNPFIHIDRNFWENISEKEKNAIIRHEIWHIKKRDNLWKLILSGLSITFFYIPTFFFLLKSFEELSELSADEFSLKKGTDRETLLSAIAKTAVLHARGVKGSSFGSSPLLKRISLIEKNCKPYRHSLFLVIPLILMAFSLYSFLPPEHSCQTFCNLKHLCIP
jgi:Zn-dependent protease with chaperone function